MSKQTASLEVLDREYLSVRAKILEIAASLDRIDRAAGEIEGDPRWEQLYTAIDILQSPGGNRAEPIQLLFSRPYDAEWRDLLELTR